MKNKIAVIFACALCALALIFAYVDMPSEKNEVYDIVFFGDSIIAGDHNDSWTVPALIEKQMDVSVLNAAIGGTTLSGYAHDRVGGDVGNIYSLSALAESVKNDDFSVQNLASQRENVYIDEWREKVSYDLSKINWGEVEYIIIEQCANDYITGVTLDNEHDLYDRNTFGGALRSAIEAFRKTAPNAEIIVVTPIYMFLNGYDKDCFDMDFGGGTLDKYVEKEMEIARDYEVIVIDNFHEVMINRDNYQDYIPGGLHGNYEGNVLIAENIIKHLKELDERN